MRTVDTSLYSADKPSRIKPDPIDLSTLPRIENPSASPERQEVFVSVNPAPENQPQVPTERKTVRFYYLSNGRPVDTALSFMMTN